MNLNFKINDMEIKKITVRKYHILQVSSKPFAECGKFKNVRERIGRPEKVYERCFMCNRKYAENEFFYLIITKEAGAQTLCEECAQKALKQLAEERKQSCVE